MDSEFYLFSLQKLEEYCREESFKGWDPYDGLNSRIFQATPLKRLTLARLIWIQLFKRNPVNLRNLLLVPKEHNAKGVALFLTGYCNLYNYFQKTGDKIFGSDKEILEKIIYLADLLISLQSRGYSGACWGYNFDWQNRVFFQPRHTPTVVATSFCADSLFNAFETVQNEKLLKIALSACDFIEKDLNRIFTSTEEFIFSYSPLDHSKVYNASLLGARLLARGYHYSRNKSWMNQSFDAVKTIVNKQNSDGSWIYGEDRVQSWIDSFHTGFNLECIFEFMKYAGIEDFKDSFKKGLDFYLTNFFLDDGTPKYYNNKIFPIDIHCPAQLIATLSKVEKFKENHCIADKIMKWAIINMQSPRGYFYYQQKKGISSKIPYMRWAQAWMFYALSYHINSSLHENMD